VKKPKRKPTPKKHRKDPPVIEVDPNAPLPGHVFVRLLVTDGPKCAAWLVRTYRFRFRAVGLMKLHTPRGRREPIWFQLAIETLKRRDWNWSVTVEEFQGGTQYTIRWVHWLGRPTDGPLPLVFARGGKA